MSLRKVSKLLYQVLAKFEDEDMPVLFGPALDRVWAILGRIGDVPIDRSQETAIRREIGDAVSAIFVAPVAGSPYADGRSAFGTDGVTPVSPYADRLIDRLIEAMAGVVGLHFQYIKKRLPADLVTRVASADAREFFRPNPLAKYDSFHTWVDPNGYRLADRIWNTAATTRAQIDRLISEGIRDGRSALAIAKDLEPFLQPGKQLQRTKKPYGRDANYPALRLARSEITRAHSQASRAAAAANPFTSGMEWKLSVSHPKIDICDQLATLGMKGERLRDPYPVDKAPIPVEDSHPNCLCSVFASVMNAAAERKVIDDIRARLDRNETPNTSPLTPVRFLDKLLGGNWFQRAFKYIQTWLAGVV